MRRRSTPGAELAQVQRHLEELLELLAVAPQAPPSGFSPAVDLRESAAAYTVVVDLPGVPGSEGVVTLCDRELRITGHKPPRGTRSHHRHCHHMERGFGAFAVEIVVPGPVHPEAARAVLKAGVLAVTLPRLQERRHTEHALPVREEEP